MEISLDSVSTSQLVRKLEKREGVEVVEVAPYDKYNVEVEGSAVVLIVVD